MTSSDPALPLPHGFDHLVVATPHLDRTVHMFGQSTGVNPVFGGDHPQKGTRNYLVGLAPSAYLEIIGRSPDSDSHEQDLPFRIGQLSRPVVATWALRTPNIETVREAASDLGFETGTEVYLSRQTPDGRELRWQLTPPYPEPSGVVPFLIDWGTTLSPAVAGLPAVDVSRFSARHPDPNRIEALLRGLGTNLQVCQGRTSGLSLRVETPKGTVVMDDSTVRAW